MSGVSRPDPGTLPSMRDEELERVVPVVAASAPPCRPRPSASTLPSLRSPRRRSPPAPTSSTTSRGRAGPTMAELAAAAGVPLLVVMHGRAEARYDDLVAEVMADLRARARAGHPRRGARVEPARRSGVRVRQDGRPQRPPAARARIAPRAGPADRARDAAQVDARADPRPAAVASAWKRPWPRRRSGSRAGIDIVRVHDVRANVRAARVSDAIVRGRWRADAVEGGPP